MGQVPAPQDGKSANESCAISTFAGRGNWRVPSREEVYALPDYNNGGKVYPFRNLPPGKYICGIGDFSGHSSTRCAPLIPFSPQQNPLHLIKRNLIVRPIVELGGTWALMRGHHLCLLQQPVIKQVRRNARGAEGMTPNRGVDAGSQWSALYHAVATKVLSEEPKFREFLRKGPVLTNKIGLLG
jgi:hypothetical protein